MRFLLVLLALATLRGIDDQFEREFEIFKAARKSLVTFLYQNGTPPPNPTTTLQNAQSEITSLKSQLENLTTATTPEKALQIASQINFPDNPVALSLEDHREALVDQNKLLATGIGHQHPEAKALEKRLTAAKTLALQELSTIEESLHVRLYQLERNIVWFQKTQTLSTEKKAELENQHRQKKSAYRTSLNKLRQIESALPED